MAAENVSRENLIIERAMAVVERSRERRERWEREKQSRFERIQIANMQQPMALQKPGRQLSLKLDG